MNIRSLLPLLLTAALSACQSSRAPEATSAPLPPPAAAELCVSSDCGELIPLVDIPDAENILFTEDGRLFVSGGLNVYEITRNGESFSARPMADRECNFTGLAIRNNYLYASCSDSRFYAGFINDAPLLTEIFRFTGMCIPNGTALGPDGRIYVVDEPLNCLEADPKIVQLSLDPTDPLRVLSQVTWIQGSPAGLLPFGQDNVLRFPNGLVRDGNIFYGTDGGSVYSVTVSNSGEAGEVTPLFFAGTAHDDLGFAGDSLLVTDFFAGRIFQLSLDGELLQETLPGTFASPSSVRLARPPMFLPTDILVTEKGVLGDGGELPVDRLSLFRRVSP